MNRTKPIPTDELISRLANDASPVVPLRPPVTRALFWFSAAAIVTAAIVLVSGPRLDLGVRLNDPRFVFEFGLAMATSLLAATAAFFSTRPGSKWWERSIATPAVGMWFVVLGGGCLADWLWSGDQGLMLDYDLVCFPKIILLSIVPAVILVAMLRREAPIAPFATLALATLASASLAAAALRLIHDQDASLMVLIWQFGSVMTLTLIGAALGQKLVRWPVACPPPA